MQSFTDKEGSHSDVASLQTTLSYQHTIEHHEKGNNISQDARSEEPVFINDQEKYDTEAQMEKMNVEPLTPPLVKVPRHKRRGLLSRLTIVAEVEQPRNYPRGTKWFITFIISLAAVAAPLGTTIFFRR